MTRLRIAGLAILGLLSLLDLVGPLVTDGEHPPMEVALVGAVLGLASLVLVGYAWRGATRALAPLVVLRLLSAAAAAPAFFVDDVPVGATAFAGAFVALSVVGVALLARPAPAREVAVR
jgi:hypothetical protein